jgi:hypothetical protein
LSPRDKNTKDYSFIYLKYINHVNHVAMWTLAHPTWLHEHITMPLDLPSPERLLTAPQLLCKAVELLVAGHTAEPTASPSNELQWLQVDVIGQRVFGGWGTQVSTIECSASRSDGRPAATAAVAAATPSNGAMPAPFELAAAAVAWIAADVGFDIDAQRQLLAPDALCFGSVGAAAVADGNTALAETIRFGMPHPIMLSHRTRTVSWDFDIIDRGTGDITGRGTDVVHFGPPKADGTGTAAVVRVNTLRHISEQPAWVCEQICRDHSRADQVGGGKSPASAAGEA